MCGEIGKFIGTRIEPPAKTPEQPKQVNVGNGVFSDRPISPAQALVGDAVYGSCVFGTLAPCRMHSRGNERHPRHYLRLGLDISAWQQPGFREPARKVEQNARNL